MTKGPEIIELCGLMTHNCYSLANMQVRRICPSTFDLSKVGKRSWKKEDLVTSMLEYMKLSSLKHLLEVGKIFINS